MLHGVGEVVRHERPFVGEAEGLEDFASRVMDLRF